MKPLGNKHADADQKAPTETRGRPERLRSRRRLVFRYEIDLSGEHSDELRKALGKYIEHSRKVGAAARRAARGGRGANGIDAAVGQTDTLITWNLADFGTPP